MEHPVKNAVNAFMILLLLVGSSFTQEKEPNMDDFFKYLGKSYRGRMPASVLADCNWNFAALILRTDKSNKVVKVDFANEDYLHNDFKQSFDYLTGYQFPTGSLIKQRPLVFFVTVEQMGGRGCNEPTRYTPSVAAQRIFMIINDHKTREPNSIFIHKCMTFVAGGAVRKSEK